MGNDACPSDDVLIAFSLGDLPEIEQDRVRRHQESCEGCEQRARLLDERTDWIVETLRKTVALSERADGRPGGAEGNAPELPDYEVGPVPLGRGSTGIVYKARHRRLNRAVALKMIAGTSREISELFEIEARAAARLLHPNIVQIFDIGTHEGQPFLALEFVEGGSLAEKLKLKGGLHPPKDAAALARTLALAVHHAHQQGIIHCDLKPSNILIGPDGVPKITDFGVAKWLGPEHSWGLEGDVIGTPRYMAPEQAGGQVQLVGPSTDVYSLGVVLYELLTGRPPHMAPTSRETLALVRENDPAPPRQFQPKLPRDLETIVLKCLRKSPEKRYADANALAEDLDRFERGLPIQARPVHPLERARAWGRRHPAACWAFVISAFWMAAMGLLLQYHRTTSLSSGRGTTLADAPPRRTKPDVPVFTVRQNEDGSINLWPIHAAIVGDTIALEAHNGNLGYWHSVNDRAIWAFRVDRAATYTIDLDYACAAPFEGNAYRVRVDDQVFEGTVVRTGSTWLNYQTFPLGQIPLQAGPHRLEVRSAGPIRPRSLFDLRSVVLRPIGAACRKPSRAETGPR